MKASQGPAQKPSPRCALCGHPQRDHDVWEPEKWGDDAPQDLCHDCDDHVHHHTFAPPGTARRIVYEVLTKPRNEEMLILLFIPEFELYTSVTWDPNLDALLDSMEHAVKNNLTRIGENSDAVLTWRMASIDDMTKHEEMI
jgi:hypothetical protein